MSFWLLHKWMKVRVKSRQQIRKLWQYIRWEKKYNVSAIRDIVWRQLTRCDSEEVDVIKEHVRVCSRSNCWHLLRQKSLEEKHIVNIISFSDLYVSFRPLLRISNPMTPAMCRGFRYLYFHFRSSTSLAISFWLPHWPHMIYICKLNTTKGKLSKRVMWIGEASWPRGMSGRAWIFSQRAQGSLEGLVWTGQLCLLLSGSLWERLPCSLQSEGHVR